MKTYLKYILSGCLIFFTHTLESKTLFQHGLTFNSYEVEKEERTSLNLTPEKPFLFSNGFILEFDVSFKQVLHNFGYVFRIVGEGDETIDLLLNRTRNSYVLEPQLTAIYKSGQILCNLTFEELNTHFDHWIKVKIAVDSKEGAFKLKINDKEFEKREDYFKKLKKVSVVFGKNDILSYETSDVPAMSIRDVSIKNKKEKPIYFWKLAQHAEHGVYDEIKNYFASTKAPKWILDNHAYWQKDTVFTTNIYPQFAFNRAGNQIGIADKKTFYTYDIATHTLEKYANTSGVPLANKSNNLLYSTLHDAYFTYNFLDKVAYYDIEAHTWTNDILDEENPYYWHHNRFFSEPDSTLYTLGGYGFHIYKNDVNAYHFGSGTWERGEYKGDTIAPRYLAGLGALNDQTVLLFGGYGSEKGGQEFSPRNYYDLYTYNVETSASEKKWELNERLHNFVVANSLVVDTLNKCFYALCFPHQKFNTALQLYRFSIEEPVYEILADSIPYSFSDIFSYADLYLSKDEQQLIVITSYTDEKSSKATVSIYRLAFSPLNQTDLLQKENKGSNFFLYFTLSLLLLVFLLLWVRKNYTERGRKSKETIEDNKKQAENNAESDIYGPIVGIKPLHEKLNKQSILLFGGFQVMDKKSNNVTGEFTPTLKQLFLLILLYTLKDGKGISSVKLREILWFDKSNESAKNNRGVSLSKLRTIFEKVGGISISSANSYWTVEFDEEIYCDYYEALILMNRITKEADHKDINRLVSIVSAGELLPNIQIEWADTFKSDFSNKLIDLFLNLIHHASDFKLTPSMMVNIADAIFTHDSLNEDALKVKCSLLVKMGKNGLAQKVYASFMKEYQALFGVDFKYTFEQIIV